MSTDARQADRVQTVRNAWINALRSEVLRTGSTDLARVAHVGIWIATYADADGGNAFPARDTLATLAGCTKETATRAANVLISAGMLAKKRRPNQSSVYQLLMPVERPDWSQHLCLYTETRQRRAYAVKKAAALEERTASVDAIRTASTTGVPDGVHGGPSGQRPRTPSDDPDSVHGRSRMASTDAIRMASTAVAYQYPPTSGRDPHNDHDTADLPPQPQVRAGARGENDHSAPTNPLTDTAPPQPVDALAEFRRAREKIRGRRDTA